MNRDEAKDRIHADPTPIYSLMEKAKAKVNGEDTYICPFCGHGKGGDGIRLNGDGKFHCFSCEKSGDAIDIYAKLKGIENDYTAALYQTAALYGLQIDILPQKPVEELTPEEKQARINKLAARDIEYAQRHTAHPDYIEYLNRRGISPRLAQFFGLGFIPDWRHPKVIVEGKNPPPSPRLIVPTGKCSYLARDTRTDAQIPAEAENFKKQKVGGSVIFNADALKTATRPLFIVEGEIDAISFYEVGGLAVGLGSTSNIDRLLLELSRMGKKGRTREPFIIALDNDDAGQKNTAKLAQGLENLQIRYTIANPAGDFKDANEALVKDRTGFADRVRTAERAELDADTNAAHLDELYKEFAATPEPIPTGFSFLDDLLDGGLLTGLYFIGGVSSSGKTAFCMQIVDQVAQAGGSSLVFAAEMSRADLIARSISRETVAAGGGNDHLYFTQREVQAGYRFADYSEGRLQNLDAAYTEYRKYAGRITIYENHGADMKPSAIRNRIARYCYLTGERPLVLVDYLQILTPENDRQDIRNCIDDTIRALKGIATEFSLPIIVVSSLNRDNYTAPLNFAAFKESGNIEYGADYLFGLQFSCIHEPEFTTGTEKNKAALLERLAEEKQKPIREVEISILKQRGGRSSGIVRFAYDARHNAYSQCQQVEDYLTSNFKDLNEQREHRARLTGHAIAPEDCPPVTHYTTRKKPL